MQLNVDVLIAATGAYRIENGDLIAFHGGKHVVLGKFSVQNVFTVSDEGEALAATVPGAYAPGIVAPPADADPASEPELDLQPHGDPAIDAQRDADAAAQAEAEALAQSHAAAEAEAAAHTE